MTPISKLAAVLFLVFVAICAAVASSRYPGSAEHYFAFTLLVNALLLSGFRRRALFFDAFIGIFIWLGFWLKFTLRIAFADGQFVEQTGAFNFSPEAYDHALSVVNWGGAALLVASYIRERFWSYPNGEGCCERSGLFSFYCSNRKLVLSMFVATVAAFAAVNYGFGIYQRGMVAQTVLPFGLSGVFKWLLQFGFASVSALVIRFELELNRGLSKSAVLIPLLESVISNASLLSRGMVLNCSALVLGGVSTLRARKFAFTKLQTIFVAVAFVVFFAASVYAVNFLRVGAFEKELGVADQATSRAVGMTTPLIIDRWVGIEGVMAVTSSRNLGWPLWREAWNETYQEGVYSLFDTLLLDSPNVWRAVDQSRNHFVSLPGIIAFLYYPGSIAFLCISIFLCSTFASFFEIVVYRICGENLVLASLIAQVIAFRYASFGYVPAQSYLLFGTLAINVLMIAALDKWLRHHYNFKTTVRLD